MLTLLGFHVLLIQNERDISEEEDKLNLSQKYKVGNYSSCKLPVYSIEERKESEEKEKKVVISSMALKREYNDKGNRFIPRERAEKSFEELALLAASVVLIMVHNDHGEVIGSGSGIMIGRDGYILTNLHVLSHGRSYTIRIENDEQEYRTDEIIKYHSNLLDRQKFDQLRNKLTSSFSKEVCLLEIIFVMVSSFFFAIKRNKFLRK